MHKFSRIHCYWKSWKRNIKLLYRSFWLSKIGYMILQKNAHDKKDYINKKVYEED